MPFWLFFYEILLIVTEGSGNTAFCHLLEQVWILDVVLDGISDGVMSLGAVAASVSIHLLLLPLLFH